MPRGVDRANALFVIGAGEAGIQGPQDEVGIDRQEAREVGEVIRVVVGAAVAVHADLGHRARAGGGELGPLAAEVILVVGVELDLVAGAQGGGGS